MTNYQKQALEMALSFVNSHHPQDCDGGDICGGCKTKAAIELVLNSPCLYCKGTGKTHFINDDNDYICEICHGSGVH